MDQNQQNERTYKRDQKQKTAVSLCAQHTDPENRNGDTKESRNMIDIADGGKKRLTVDSGSVIGRVQKQRIEVHSL